MLIPAYSSCTYKQNSKQTPSNTGEGNYTHKGTSVSGPRHQEPAGLGDGGLTETPAVNSHCLTRGKMPDWGDPAAFRPTVVHLVWEGYLMLLAPVGRATPLFLPSRFRIYLACIIVYFDPGAANNGRHVMS